MLIGLNRGFKKNKKNVDLQNSICYRISTKLELIEKKDEKCQLITIIFKKIQTLLLLPV